MAEVIMMASAADGVEAAVAALSRAVPLDAPLNQMERMSLAIGSTFPRYHVIISTAGMTHEELARAFDRFKLNVERATKEPLIYWGVCGNGAGDGGEHLHLLVWKKPKMRIWQPAREAAGLGWTKAIPIKKGIGHALREAAYVGGQQVSVFGSREHDSAASRRKERPWMMPHDATLRKRHPELLKATEAAKAAITDEELFAGLPALLEPLTAYEKGCVMVMAADGQALLGLKTLRARVGADARPRRAAVSAKRNSGRTNHKAVHGFHNFLEDVGPPPEVGGDKGSPDGRVGGVE